MPLELKRLQMQLWNLKVMLEDAILNKKSWSEQKKISDEIEMVERLIEEKVEYLKNLDK